MLSLLGSHSGHYHFQKKNTKNLIFLPLRMNIYMKGINHMRINSGLQNELDLIKAIDGKRFDDFGNNIKNLMKAMYDDFDDDIFVVTKEDPRAKPDIAVTYHGKTFHISIKSGGAEHIHCEDIKKFILSLRARGISKETQKTILKFQFGDGTLDGTGKDRLPYQTIFLQMQDEIKAANIELNRNRELVVDYVTKFLFHGNHEDLPSADYIYFGTPDFGVLASENQVIKHLQRKNWNYINSLHFGPVIFGPRARFINHDERQPQRRYYVAFKWGRLSNDIDYISRHYDD